MRRAYLFPGTVLLVAAVSLLGVSSPVPAAQSGTPWSYDATYIEACSCDLFCPCYFNNHAQHPYCEFQMAIRLNDGNVGEVALKGARFWLTGDLGAEWGTVGKSPWLVVTFDPAVSQAQRDAILKILPKLYPVQFAKVDVDESKITWLIQGTEARAKLANGKGEMVLERHAGANGGPVVLTNVNYFAANSNRGFVMYKSKVHRWDGFGHQFSYSGRNAFTIRVEANGTL
jgi:hypothetical protein